MVLKSIATQAATDTHWMACNYHGGAPLPVLWRSLRPEERTDLNRSLQARRLRASVFSRLLLRAGMSGGLSSGAANSRIRPYSAGAVLQAAKAEAAWPVIRYRRPPADRCPLLQMHGSYDEIYASIAHDDEFCVVAWDFGRSLGCDVRPIIFRTDAGPGSSEETSTRSAFRTMLTGMIEEAFFKLACRRDPRTVRDLTPAGIAVELESDPGLLQSGEYARSACRCGPDREPCDAGISRHGCHLFVVLSARE